METTFSKKIRNQKFQARKTVFVKLIFGWYIKNILESFVNIISEKLTYKETSKIYNKIKSNFG